MLDVIFCPFFARQFISYIWKCLLFSLEAQIFFSSSMTNEKNVRSQNKDVQTSLFLSLTHFLSVSLSRTHSFSFTRTHTHSFTLVVVFVTHTSSFYFRMVFRCSLLFLRRNFFTNMDKILQIQNELQARTKGIHKI